MSLTTRALDLFCCGGGTSRGYQLAGFQVVGVDIDPQPRYPHEFIQADAMEVLADLPFLRTFDFIHASPPCQSYSLLNAYNRHTYPDLVAPVRELLRASGVPYVIENVMQAPLLDPVVLCGSMFGLRVYRHRGFESSIPIAQPALPAHVARCARNGYLPRDGQFMSVHGGKHSRAWQRAAAEVMGLPWLTIPDDADFERTRVGIREVCEAIPPEYTRYVGGQAMRALEVAA